MVDSTYLGQPHTCTDKLPIPVFQAQVYRGPSVQASTLIFKRKYQFSFEMPAALWGLSTLPSCLFLSSDTPEEGIRSHWIPDGCKPPCGCWELNSGPLEEQSVLLTAEPSLQPSFPFS